MSVHADNALGLEAAGRGRGHGGCSIHNVAQYLLHGTRGVCTSGFWKVHKLTVYAMQGPLHPTDEALLCERPCSVSGPRVKLPHLLCTAEAIRGRHVRGLPFGVEAMQLATYALLGAIASASLVRLPSTCICPLLLHRVWYVGDAD